MRNLKENILNISSDIKNQSPEVRNAFLIFFENLMENLIEEKWKKGKETELSKLRLKIKTNDNSGSLDSKVYLSSGFRNFLIYEFIQIQKENIFSAYFEDFDYIIDSLKETTLEFKEELKEDIIRLNNIFDSLNMASLKMDYPLAPMNEEIKMNICPIHSFDGLCFSVILSCNGNNVYVLKAKEKIIERVFSKGSSVSENWEIAFKEAIHKLIQKRKESSKEKIKKNLIEILETKDTKIEFYIKEEEEEIGKIPVSIWSTMDDLKNIAKKIKTINKLYESDIVIGEVLKRTLFTTEGTTDFGEGMYNLEDIDKINSHFQKVHLIKREIDKLKEGIEPSEVPFRIKRSYSLEKEHSFEKKGKIYTKYSYKDNSNRKKKYIFFENGVKTTSDKYNKMKKEKS